jgi:hypothetical protein
MGNFLSRALPFVWPAADLPAIARHFVDAAIFGLATQARFDVFANCSI